MSSDQHLPAATIQLNELRDYFGRGGGGVQSQVKVCRAVFMWLLRKTVTPLEHNLLLVFTSEKIEGGDWLLFTIGKNEKYVIRFLKTIAKIVFLYSG